MAYDAYRDLYNVLNPSGKIVMGLELANEAWGGNVLSIPKLQALAEHIKPRGGNGMMLWVSRR